jgi:uncharacterized Zn-binding protein involved in type VI secretion
MGAPAIVMGDQVQGICAIHQIPSPVGNPMPGPPMPFSAPLTVGLCATVLIGDKPAAVLGSSGVNTPPHVGLHASDPFLAPPLQVGRITGGSPTVSFGGQPAASATATATCCMTPGTLVPSTPNVLVG